MSQKLVDGEFLAKLLDGSFETEMGRVDEAVLAAPELFGGGDGSEVRTIGTFPAQVIVLNSDGEFFRAAFSVSEETGAIELGEVERLDVPVREASELGAQARQESIGAVEALLAGDEEEADARLGALYEMVRSGVRVTAEGVEDDFLETFSEDPAWLGSLRENEAAVISFVGAEAGREYPAPKFVDAELDNVQSRAVVGDALLRLQESLREMQESVVSARSIDEESQLHVESSEDASTAAQAFFEFVAEYGTDLDGTIAMVEDAIALREDGTLGSLARVHDGVAARMKDMGLAAAFSEKFARRFDQPQA
jgi:hypothetical protein